MASYHRPVSQPLPNSVFRERLRTYLFGVGIGLVLVGFIFMERYRRAQLSAPQNADQVQTSPGATNPKTPGQP